MLTCLFWYLSVFKALVNIYLALEGCSKYLNTTKPSLYGRYQIIEYYCEGLSSWFLKELFLNLSSLSCGVQQPNLSLCFLSNQSVAFLSFVALVPISLDSGSRLNKFSLDLGVLFHHCYRVSSHVAEVRIIW